MIQVDIIPEKNTPPYRITIPLAPRPSAGKKKDFDQKRTTESVRYL